MSESIVPAPSDHTTQEVLSGPSDCDTSLGPQLASPSSITEHTLPSEGGTGGIAYQAVLARLGQHHASSIHTPQPVPVPLHVHSSPMRRLHVRKGVKRRAGHQSAVPLDVLEEAEMEEVERMTMVINEASQDYSTRRLGLLCNMRSSQSR